MERRLWISYTSIGTWKGARVCAWLVRDVYKEMDEKRHAVFVSCALLGSVRFGLFILLYGST